MHKNLPIMDLLDSLRKLVVKVPLAFQKKILTSIHRLCTTLPGSVLIWWRRCCGTAVRRGSGAPTSSKLGHYPLPWNRDAFE